MISIVIPTLGNREKELIRLLDSLKSQTYQNFEVVLLSQDHHENVAEIVNKYTFNINHVELNKKGLSISRNVGIEKVNGTIVTFSDDDCWYKETAFEEITNHFDKTNDDLTCFQIYDPETNKYYKGYPENPQNQLSLQDILRKSSIEIFINLKEVNKGDISFHEQFGLGAMYPSGEENIFLHQMYKKGYKISYLPIVMVYHKKPSIDSRLNLNAFKGKGPLFKQMFNTPIGLAMLTFLFVKKFRALERPFYFYVKAVEELFKYKKIK
jgi:glycosyltransferase involved in cell wall biosynthesis